ncbi:MAG: hypothetical protein ACFE9I_14635 [Candidatus Hermodarchaeota archaeon]
MCIFAPLRFDKRQGWSKDRIEQRKFFLDDFRKNIINRKPGFKFSGLT